MLPPFIIDQIRKREEREHVEREQPRVDVPTPRPRIDKARTADNDEKDRGVVVIDLG